eukprot:PhF_6_TR26719/c1_g1_i3/m.39113
MAVLQCDIRRNVTLQCMGGSSTRTPFVCPSGYDDACLSTPGQSWLQISIIGCSFVGGTGLKFDCQDCTVSVRDVVVEGYVAALPKSSTDTPAIQAGLYFHSLLTLSFTNVFSAHFPRGSCVTILQTSSVQIFNVELTNCTTRSNGGGLIVDNATNVVLQNIVVSKCRSDLIQDTHGGGCVSIRNVKTVYVQNAVISNCSGAMSGGCLSTVE